MSDPAVEIYVAVLKAVREKHPNADRRTHRKITDDAVDAAWNAGRVSGVFCSQETVDEIVKDIMTFDNYKPVAA